MFGLGFIVALLVVSVVYNYDLLCMVIWWVLLFYLFVGAIAVFVTVCFSIIICVVNLLCCVNSSDLCTHVCPIYY